LNNEARTSKPDAPPRLVEIDGLRGIAAIIVALFHIKIMLQGTPNPLAWVWGADLILAKGWHLVDLFFVLSGFIFSHCYLRDGTMKDGTSPASFAWARFSRLWPLHAAVLCFTAIMLFDDPSTNALNFAGSLVMMHVFLPEIEVLNPPAWSISVEVICYAIFALLALPKDKRIFAVGSVALIVTGAILILSSEAPPIGRGLLGFFVGCCVYKYRDRLDALPLPVVCAGLIPFAFLDTSYKSLVIETMICWPAAIILAPRLGFLRWNAFQWLGSRSYAIYLVHVPMFIFTGNIAMLVPQIPSEIVVVAGLSIALLVSDILHRRLEMPAQQFLRQLSFMQPKPAT